MPLIFEKLKDRDDPNVVPQLARALTSRDIQAVNRAAWTLGNLGAVEVVPKLIPALLTNEQRIVMVARDGSNSPAIGAPGVSMVPLRYNNNGIALQTPPVISQGAVAFGVISAPFYAFPYGVGLQSRCSDQQQPGAARGDFHVSQYGSSRRASEDDQAGFWIRYRVVAKLGQSRF